MGLGWEPPPVASETVDFVRAAFAQWRNSGQDEESTAALRLALGGLSRDDTLAAAAALIRVGSEQDRLDSLWAIASEFGKSSQGETFVQSNVPDDGPAPDLPEGAVQLVVADGSSGEDPEFQARLEREAKETHDVVAIVAAGLEDASAEVRDFALETVAVLPSETSSILYSQLLCSDSSASADLRDRFMRELDGRADEEAVSLFVQAMQSPDEAVAAAAKKNLESISGLTFQSFDAVAEWLESNEQNAPGFAKKADATTQGQQKP